MKDENSKQLYYFCVAIVFVHSTLQQQKHLIIAVCVVKAKLFFFNFYNNELRLRRIISLQSILTKLFSRF